MPTLPRLDGADFRPFAGESDYPHFARIINAYSRGVGDDRVETAEGIASGYGHLERCDPERDIVVAQVDGRPVGYSRVFWDQEPDGPRVYRHFCFMDPDFGGRGIRSALFAWNERRLREIADEHDAPEQLLEVWIHDRNTAAAALARDAGYEPVTYDAHMIRPSVDDLPDHRLPEGVEIRPVREEHLRTIWEADVEAFRDHWGFVEPSEESYQRFLSFPYHDPTLWKIAWDEKGVVGQVRSFIDTAQNAELVRQRGWTEFISTARRGHGAESRKR